MEKNFIDWHNLKAHLDTQKELPSFYQREIWWCSIGANIGHEMDGKSELFSRPVLIIRKFNRHIFFGVPLTTQVKSNPYYYTIHFKGSEQCVLLSQLRLWESRRLTRKMGQLPEEQFDKIRQKLRELI